MKRVLVVYKSKYGSTSEYALNIANKLNADVIEMGQWNTSIIDAYDVYIFGCPIYMGNIAIGKVMRSDYPALKNKQIIVFTVGITPIEEKQYYQTLMEKYFIQEQLDHIKLFHLYGKIQYDKLNWFNKKIMSMICHATANKKEEEQTAKDKELIQSFGTVLDRMNLSATDEIVSYVRDIK